MTVSNKTLTISDIEDIISSNTPIEWYRILYTYTVGVESLKLRKGELDKIKDLIITGLEKKLIFGEFPQYFKYTDILELISDYSAKLIENKINLNSDVEPSSLQIIRSSTDKINPGKYIYKISADERIQFYSAYQIIDFEGKQYIVLNDYANIGLFNFDLSRENVKVYSILGDHIVKNTSSIHTKSKPGLGTALTEHLFGSSYATLKGLNRLNIHNSQEVIDTRTVQVVLKDNTDIEIKGPTFLSHLNRVFGSPATLISKSKQSESGENDVSRHTTIVSAIKEYKLLLDEGIISQEEFSELKKKIINEV